MLACIRFWVLSWFALFVCLATPLAAKSPYPEFWVRAQFEMRMARVLADGCDQLEFDYAAERRHRRSAMMQMSDRGIHARNLSKHFAPIGQERFDRQFLQFMSRHNLTSRSSDEAFCAAGVRERTLRTDLGLMLNLLD